MNLSELRPVDFYSLEKADCSSCRHSCEGFMDMPCRYCTHNPEAEKLIRCDIEAHNRCTNFYAQLNEANAN